MSTPTINQNFEGIGNGFLGANTTPFTPAVAPPDTAGAVGPNNYVQIVNDSYAVFDKTGTALLGPQLTSSIWNSMSGTNCQTNGQGDGTVNYDRVADRWVIQQFAFPLDAFNNPIPPFSECIAVSTTGDPTGTYALYEFVHTNFPDYPKLAVWPDAYYVTINDFDTSASFGLGPEVCAYERSQMLVGSASAREVCISVGTGFGTVFSLLAADLDGTLEPPLGAPNPVVGLDNTNAALSVRQFHVDWSNTANSTLSAPTAVAGVTAFTRACTPPGGNCTPRISQPGNTNQLDSLGDRLMNRLAYRRFAKTDPTGAATDDREVLMINHTVRTTTSSAGPFEVRWYEVRDPNGSPTVFQSGTFGPDGDSRWMASIAMNGAGTIGLGYSAVNSSTTTPFNPSIRVTGRSSATTAAAGTLDGGEAVVVAGGGVQTTFTDIFGGVHPLPRWGDYSSLTVDPSDDCTFWYTNEYIASDGAFNWQTRVASFTVGSCVSLPCAARATGVGANSGSVTLNSSTLVDSYKSKAGAYGGTNVGNHGTVKAGTTIVKNGNAVVHGAQIQHSPGGLSPIPPPASATNNLGTLLVNSGATRTLTAGDYRASSVTLNGNSTLRVTGGAVRIWVSGAVAISGAANNNGIPSNLQFFMTSSQTVQINGGARVFALIYAPLAQIFVNAPVFGSVLGNSITLNSGGQLHFDESSSGTSSSASAPAACPVIPQGSCLPTSSNTTLITPANDVFAYVPLGSWRETTLGVRRVHLEGPGTLQPPTTIATTQPVNSCATNNVAPGSQPPVVCTANDTSVYLINGTTLSTTLSSGATSAQDFSGGSCENCGVAVDGVRNRAFLEMGLASGGPGGFQFLDLATNTFATPIGAAAPTSEDILIDPVRNLVLSPNESNSYQLFNNFNYAGTLPNFAAASSVFNSNPAGVLGEMDSAAEDCSTGIALSSVEFSGANAGQIVLVDLTQVATGLSGSVTSWSAPSNAQVVTEFATGSVQDPASGPIAVAPGNSHLGFVAAEFGGSLIGAMKLPSNAGAAVASPALAPAPALVDWVAAHIPNDPSGQPWATGLDPHTATVYISPLTGKAYGVTPNVSRTFVAIVDLQALLAAPRIATSTGPNNVDPAQLPAGCTASTCIVRFVAM